MLSILAVNLADQLLCVVSILSSLVLFDIFVAIAADDSHART